MALMIWTEAAIDTLRGLWDDGYSCSRIASMMGEGLTRNAIIGKVHRLKLSARAAKKYPPKPLRIPRAMVKKLAVPKARKPTRKPWEPRQVVPDIAPEPFVFTTSAWAPLPGSVPVTMEHMTGCKWPVSDPFAPPSAADLFCNCATVDGKPWCREHLARSAGAGRPSERRAIKTAYNAVRLERYEIAA